MKNEKKDHPVLFALKLAGLLLFVVIPIMSWQKAWDAGFRMHDKNSKDL